MTLPLPARTRRLGQSDVEVTALAWGMWRLRGGDVRYAAALVHSALESGITLFDTADIYGPDNGEPFGAAEALLGRVLQAEPGLRRQIVLATKGGISMGVPYDSSAAYLVAACEASLRRLGTEAVELYQIHRPDILAHSEEVAGAFDRLRQSGKIVTAGVSNYTPAQTEALMRFMPFPLASIQPELSALAISPIEDGTLDLAMRERIGVLAWSPLGGGRLASDSDDTRTRAVAACLDSVAQRCGVSRTAAAYAWVMAHPAAPIPIVGSQTPARIRESAQALEVEMTRAEWYGIYAASRGAPLP
jgi:predicted oxidoreductase